MTAQYKLVGPPVQTMCDSEAKKREGSEYATKRPELRKTFDFAQA